jgi:two-component system NarL family response regulator
LFGSNAAHAPAVPLQASVAALAWLGMAARGLRAFPGLAPEAILDGIDDSIFVLDSHRRVIDLNRSARVLLDLPADGPMPPGILGRPLPVVLGTCPALAAQYARTLAEPGQAAGSAGAEGPGVRVFEVHQHELKSSEGRSAGAIVAAHEVTEQQAALARQQAAALAEAREQFGSDVHSTVGQTLAYISSQTEAIRDLVHTGQTAPAIAALDHLEEIAEHSLASLRACALGLGVGRVASNGLFDVLAAYLDRFQECYGLNTHLSLPEPCEVPLTPAVEVQVIDIVREALTNTRKHAAARSVRVTVTTDDDHLQLLIDDDGCGFVAAPEADPASGTVGLKQMFERATAVGGRCEVRSQPGHGTSVILRVPLGRRVFPGGLSGLSVLIADGQRLFSEGLHNLLAACGARVVGKVHEGDHLVATTLAAHPDLILMDLVSPGGDSIAAIRSIKAALPATKIVILTVTDDVALLFAALQAGACGHLPKNVDAEVFFERLVNIARGETVLPPPLAARLLAEFSEAPASRPLTSGELTQLSARQRDVLARVSAGQTYKEIGAALYLSERTIRYHMSEILANLHLNTRAEAIAYARRAGLTNHPA